MVKSMVDIRMVIADDSLPPVLCDPVVQKAHYEIVEKEVEKGVKESATREKAYPAKVVPQKNTAEKSPAESTATQSSDSSEAVAEATPSETQ
jgi:hypothetical protein